METRKEGDDPSISKSPPKKSALDHQEGGAHYRLPIQPLEYIHVNNLSFVEGNIIKYVTRWRSKNGLEDLRKAAHYLEYLIETETPKLLEYVTETES